MKDKITSTTTEPVYKTFRLPRENDVPLRFRGFLLGSYTEEKRDNDSYYEVSIYATAAGKFVVERACNSNSMERWARDAAAFADAEGVVGWLRRETGELGWIEKAALERAGETNAKIAAAFAEDVE